MEGGEGGGEVVLLENAKGVGVAQGAEEGEGGGGGGGGDEPGAGTTVRGGRDGGGIFGVKNVWVGLGGNGVGVSVGVVAGIEIG